MGPPPGLARRGRLSVLAGVAVAGVIDAVAASTTHPFTLGADLVTAGPLIVVLVVTLLSIGSRDRHDAGHDTTRSKTKSRRWLWWLAPLLAVTGWELYCFFSLPRVDHPTLSALIDMLDATAVGKFVAFAAWLAFGWFLVTS